MARPREFDETAVLDAAINCFWMHGYEATSVRDLAERMQMTGASLYNAFGDKRSLFRQALERYVDQSFGDRVRRFELLPPREAIGAFFQEIIDQSLDDKERKGCLLVNCALELSPHDTEFQEIIGGVLVRVETFFGRCVTLGQKDGSITDRLPSVDLARHLLGSFLGIRVLARSRPERALLEGLISPTFALLDNDTVKRENYPE